LEEYTHSYKVFRIVLPVCEAFVSAGLGSAMRVYWHLPTFGHVQEV
jgi:hypothetical protein